MKVLHLALAGAGMFGLSTAAAAQSDAPTGPADPADAAKQAGTSGPEDRLSDIIVTGARQRSENLQSVPIAVTALDANAIQRSNIVSVADIERAAPNLQISRQGTTVAQANIFLRGFGNASSDPAIDPPIAVYQDGIYQPQSSGSLLDLFDVEGIEVERGPQGTLLGKNAPTGAISIRTRRPTFDLQAAGEASYSRFDRRELKGRLNIPIVDDVLAVKFSGSYRKGGNYIFEPAVGKRIYGGESVVGGHVSVLFTPSTDIEWLVNAGVERFRTPPSGGRSLPAIGVVPPFQGRPVACAVALVCTQEPRYTSRTNIRQKSPANYKQVSSQLKFNTEPVTLTFVTGYLKYHEAIYGDVDGSSAPVLHANGSALAYDQFSQEVRVSSRKGGGLDLDGHIDWIVGAFYSDFDYDRSSLISSFGRAIPTFQTGKAESKALFAHVLFNVTDELSLTVGGRQSWDRKKHTYIPTGTTTVFVDKPLNFSNFSLELGAQYKFTPDKMVYFRYGEGYRSGGYIGVPSPAGTQAPYNAELAESYEVGFKADFFDKRLRTNLAIFYSKYTDLQRTTVRAVPIAPFFQQLVQNAANADVRGIELEVTAIPAEGLTIATSASYLKPKYKNYVAALVAGSPPTDNSNFPFAFASKYTLSVSPRYDVQLGEQGGMISLNANASYASSYYITDIPIPAGRVGAMVKVNASVRYTDPSDSYYVSLWGRNLTDRKYFRQVGFTPGNPNSTFLFGLDSEPITYGLTAGFRF